VKRRRLLSGITFTRWRVPIVIATVIAVIAALEISGLAAVPVPAAGVSLWHRAANLSFGREKAADTVVETAPLFDDSFDFAFDDGSFADTPFTPPRPTASLCPEAGPTDFPEEPAGFDTKGQPRPGSYLWKESGKVDLLAPVALSFPVGPYTDEFIRNVEVAANGSFTYDYVWTTELVGTETDTILVVPTTAASTSNPAGIYLERVHIVPVQGDVIDFAPLTPVLLLSLPVALGATVGSPAPYVDLANRRAMTFQGTVSKKERYDACGTVIEAWFIKATRLLSSIGSSGPRSEDQSTTFDIAVAPHLGGIIVALHRVGNGSFSAGAITIAFQYDMTTSIGTLTPRSTKS